MTWLAAVQDQHLQLWIDSMGSCSYCPVDCFMDSMAKSWGVVHWEEVVGVVFSKLGGGEVDLLKLGQLFHQLHCQFTHWGGIGCHRVSPNP